MRENTTALLTLGGLLTLTIVVMSAGATLSGLDAKFAAILHPTARSTMQSISQKVVNQSGQTATITTEKSSDETVEEWLARHSAAVAAFEASK